MSARTFRLPLLFALVALGCIALIGSVSFEGALDATARSQTAILENLAHHIAEDIPDRLLTGHRRDLVQRLNRHTLDTFMIAIRDNRGRMIAAAPDDRPTHSRMQPLPAETDSKPGHRLVTDENPLFSIVAVRHTGYTVTVAYTPARNSPALFTQTMLVPFVISSLLVLWLAVWSGIAFARHLMMLDHQKQELERLALHDPLTGLPNRNLWNERLTRVIEQARRDKTHFAVGVLDLDGFKAVNDALGHKRGDQLLVDLAHRATGAIRTMDTFARMGGDEFALLMPGTDAEEAHKVTDRLLERIREDIDSEQGTLHIAASLGIAIFPDHADSADALMRKADRAMYEAKRTQSGPVFAV